MAKDSIISDDSIVLQKIKKTWYYSFKGKIINNKDLKEILQSNNQATKIFKQSKRTGFISSVLALLGGACISVPIGNLLNGDKADWSPAAIGAGLVLIALPIVIQSEKQEDKAINTYNRGIKKSSMIRKELKIDLTNHGIGLCIKF